MASSILHRATSVANSLGALLIVGWLLSLTLGPQAYQAYQGFFATLPAQIILLGFTIAVAYHTLNGVRHLVWDSGHGFNPKVADMSGIFCMVVALLGGSAIWWFAIGGKAILEALA
jgi:succinate dehydrogenase / fumarate reductase cytochrome b subunit